MRDAGRWAGFALLLAAGCVDSGPVTVVPSSAPRASLVGTELRIAGVHAALLLRREGDEVTAAPGLAASLGETPLEVVRVDADGVLARVVSPLAVGAYPVGLQTAARTWAGPDFLVVDGTVVMDGGPSDASVATGDGGPPDSGLMDAGAQDAGTVDAEASADAGPPPVVLDVDRSVEEILGVDIPFRCEADPALTPDRRFLLLGWPAGACTGARWFRVLEWNGGAPIDTGEILGNDNYRSLHVLAGSVIGSPADYAVVATLSGDLVMGAIEGDPPVFVDPPQRLLSDASAASLTADGALVFYSDNDRLYERADPLGTPGPRREMTELAGEDLGDPAISADGRVLIYDGRRRSGEDLDLYVATRLTRGVPFEDARRLPIGTGLVNTNANETDPYLTEDGDLLFTSDRDGGDREVFILRGVYVP
jgi:hypothetical protein